MAKVHYVTCPACAGRYYLDRLLFEIIEKNPAQHVKCPFCKTEFVPKEASAKSA